MGGPFAVDPVALSRSADTAYVLGADLTDAGGPVRSALSVSRAAAEGLYGWSTGGVIAGVTDRWDVKVTRLSARVAAFADAARGAVILIQTTDNVNADGLGG